MSNVLDHAAMANVRVVTESKDSFYVHLLSNAQPHVFKNKANHFKCQFETALQFPSDESWEVGLKEYHYVNNIDTITQDLSIEVGRLAPKRETWRSSIQIPTPMIHDADKVDYPFYFTECGTRLSTYAPFRDLLPPPATKQTRQAYKPMPHLISAFLNFLQQQRLLNVIRIVKDKTDFQLKLRNTTSAASQVYFPCQYMLCMSHLLAVILKAGTQCLKNDYEALERSNGIWTQNAYSWLGDETHFHTLTLRTNVVPHKKLASTLVDSLCRRLKKTDRHKISNPFFFKRMEVIERFLYACAPARSNDFTFTMIPLHRNKMQRIKLSTTHLTYVDLFRHLEELGYGKLIITPDQASLTFTMHDLKDSNLFAVELPTSLFARYNKRTSNFFQPQVRVDQWQRENNTYIRRDNVPMENAFSTLELSYAHEDDEDPNYGITTAALERELSKDVLNEEQVPDVQAWVTTVHAEIQSLQKCIHDNAVPFLRGIYSPKNKAMLSKNETFLLTSKMRFTMTLDLSRRNVYEGHDNPIVYTPYDYSLYDVKLPYSPESITLLSYTQSLDAGRYDIKKDESTFRDVYTSYNTITAPKGFYTPLSLVRYLQAECDKYQYPCRFSLVNKNGDDNDQGFLQIDTSKDIYLQFNSIAQDLFRLPEAFLSPNSAFTMTNPFDLQPDSFTNIIYCDIVGESVVGSQREKILCISPIRHSDYRYGQWAGKEFASADYYPLAMKTVQQIEIQLRGDTGDFIPITQGRSYMKLHFRRKTK